MRFLVGEKEEEETLVRVSVVNDQNDVLIKLNGVIHIGLSNGEAVLFRVDDEDRVDGVKYSGNKLKIWRVN